MVEPGTLMSMDDRDRPSPIQSRAGTNRDERNRVNTRLVDVSNKPLVTRKKPAKEPAQAPLVEKEDDDDEETVKPGIPMWLIVSAVALALYLLFFR